MFISHGARQFFRNCKLLFPVCSNQHFGCSKKSSIRWIYAHQQFRKKKTVYQINGRKKETLGTDKKVTSDQKVYARDIIRNISNILRYSTWDLAREELQKLCVRWDSYTINQVLKTHPPMEKAWLFFNWASKLKGFKHDQFTYTTMLDIFGEARRISSMNFVFQQMQEKGVKIDAITYTSLLHWFANDGDVDGAVKVWEEMKAKHCHPTVVSYTAYMKVLFHHNRVKEATKVCKEMLQSGFSPNCYTYTVLMEHLADSGKYKEVLEMFNKMQVAGVLPDKATCNILIQKCCETGETWAMNKILQYMKENSLVLRYPVYLESLETLKAAGESDVLLRQVNLHFSTECATKDDINNCDAIVSDINAVVDIGLVLSFLRRKNFLAVDSLLASMMNQNTQLDSKTISTIIEVNSAHCRPNSALLAFEYGVKMGVRIERTAYLALMGVFIRTNSFPKVVNVVGEMIGVGISPGMSLGAILIYRLGLAKKTGCSAKIFDLLPDEQKNTVTYTALIAAYFSSGQANKGLKTFTAMRNKGLHATLGTYNVLLSGLERSGRVDEVEHFRKEKKQLEANGHSQNMDLLEETLCNCLFAGDTMF